MQPVAFSLRYLADFVAENEKNIDDEMEQQQYRNRFEHQITTDKGTSKVVSHTNSIQYQKNIEY